MLAVIIGGLALVIPPMMVPSPGGPFGRNSLTSLRPPSSLNL